MYIAKRFCLLLLIILCLCPKLGAEVFRYVDDQGNTHYVTKVDKVPEKYRSQVNKPHDLPSLSITKTLKYKKSASSANENKHKIELIVAPWCPHCNSLESFLKQRKVKYKRWDITTSAAAKKKYKKHGGGGIPIMIIGDTIIRGFNRGKVEKMLKLVGL